MWIFYVSVITLLELINRYREQKEKNMVVDKEYEVKINASNWQHYAKFFDDIKTGQVILCKVSQMTKTSRTKIEVVCDVCGHFKQISLKDYSAYGFQNLEYLCRKCKLEKNNLKKWGVKNVFESETIKKKIKEKVKEKFGVENISQSEKIKEKKKLTNRINYGVDWPQQSSLIKAKSLITCKDIWGVDNISKSEKVKEKKKNTHKLKTGYDYIFQNPEFLKSQVEKNISLYGVPYLLQTPIIKEKIKETNLKLYGFETPSKNTLIKEKIRKSVTQSLHDKSYLNIENLVSIDSIKKEFSIYCNLCESNYVTSCSLFYKRRETKTVCCTNCNPIDKHQSGLELSLFNFIKSIFDSEIVQNHRLENKEVDIFLPELNLGFEFNRVYWHSNLFKPKYYHSDKTRFCLQNNVSLFHIWEDDWLYKSPIIKSMISTKLKIIKDKIYARKCDLVEIKNLALVRQFLNENHIQGQTNYSKSIGLFHENELVSVMTFITRRKQWELNRFCSKINTIVVGGASKLLSYFTKRYEGDIFTFSDNSYSTGNLYLKLGFKKVYDLRPDYSYLVDGIRKHKFNYRGREKSTDLLKIWDSGKVKYFLANS